MNKEFITKLKNYNESVEIDCLKNLTEDAITIKDNKIYVNTIGYIGTYWNFDNSISFIKALGGDVIKCNEYEIKELVRLWFVNGMGE
jgi:hypothetical protein